VTARRQRQKALSRVAVAAQLAHVDRRDSDLDRVIDTIRQPLIMLDDKLRVASANRAFYRIFAARPDEVVGRPMAAIGNRSFDFPEFHSFLGLIQGESDSVDDYEITVELPKLGRRALLLNAQKVNGALRSKWAFLVAIDDVTERKRAEMELTAAKWHAERASLGKSRVLAAASHDLRQLLQTLSLMRGTLAKKIKEKEALALVAQLNKTSDVMLGMLNTLLDINQIEAGVVRPEKTNFPISEILEQLSIEFSYHAQAHGIRLRMVPCHLTIWSDPRLLQQMIRNLLSNAVKFTKQGKILLGCRRRGDNLSIEVWDTGIGISEQQLQAIFQEFHRIDKSADEVDRSFGLGLPLVQRLGKLLGHAINVRSSLGAGSVFSIEVPLGREQTGPLLRRRQPETVQRAVRHAAILIVEEDPVMREMLALLFASEGYHTATAADGGEALVLARGAIQPDIVVAGYTLPNGMTGLQVVATVCEALGHDLPAIILTGDISADTMREINRSGYIQRKKPVRSEELTHLIQSLLTEPRQSPVRPSAPQAESRVDTPRPTIFVVDDDEFVREAMRGFFQEEGWFVEVYSSGEAFLEAYRPGREGCLVVDARMPRMSGLELLDRLKTQGGEPPAIMITGHADIRLAVRAMKTGAMAFLEKPVQYDELLVNIERALELARDSTALSSLRDAAARRMATLTSRERQVVEMVVEGNPNKQIAYVLGINQRTVETHRHTAMKKIGARTLSELIHLTISGVPQQARRRRPQLTPRKN
jgi:two-component system, chemotaxis family, CheB/CheR fusion protein